MANKFEGKICPVLANGVLSNEGDITNVDRRRRAWDTDAMCLGELCVRYPVCVKEVEEAEKK